MPKLTIRLSLFLNFFLFAILLNSVGTVILQAQRYYGVNESAASVLEICKDISLAAASFLLASYITRIGYKKSMLLALAIMAAVCFAIPSLKSFGSIRFLFVAAGACFGLMKISIIGAIGIITKNEKEHLSLMNFIESFFMLGILAGYLLFSFYIDDVNANSQQWFSVYYLLGSLCVSAFILLFFARLDESAINKQSPESIATEFSGMFKLFFMPLILCFIISIFLYTLIEQSIMCWLPTYNNKQLIIPSSMSIQITGILALSICIGRFLAAFVLKRVNWFKALIFCLVAIFLLVVFTLAFAGEPKAKISSWSQVPFIAYVFPLIGLFMAPIYPVINSVVLSSLVKSKQAMAVGLAIIFSSFGGMVGSVITGSIFQTFGGKAAFYFSLVPVGLLIIMLYLFKKTRNSFQMNEVEKGFSLVIA
ncbi:MAG: MFS transporter [Chitinophagaceae bacterium]